jgi:hypothetical protein
MAQTYLHHQVMCAPRQWQVVADRLRLVSGRDLGVAGGTLFGIWRSQIGRPRDELNMITAWQGADAALAAGEHWLGSAADGIVGHTSRIMTPTLRPADATPPTRQGNYAFRFFETPSANWDEFLDLCAGAWPGFEASYDSQVIGLWRIAKEPTSDTIESLLLTRRPDLAMWERSKIPQGAEEAEVRRKLSRRYDLCDATWVHTTTLLTATDQVDNARWT